MNVKIGRNDPCWCGSGRKYKKCHLAADETAEHARLAAEQAARPAHSEDAPLSLPVMPAATPRPPELQAADAVWDRFEAAPHEERVRIVEDLIASGTPDPDDMFEMMSEIHEQVVERDERLRFRGLVERLRERASEVYTRDIVWYHSWLIEDAVAERQDDRLPALI